MKIKKIKEEINFQEITTHHLFDVNGKKVSVIDWDKQDNVHCSYEQDTTIDPFDIKGLTDLEYEAFGENLQDWLDMKEGEEQELEDYEPLP